MPEEDERAELGFSSRLVSFLLFSLVSGQKDPLILGFSEREAIA